MATAGQYLQVVPVRNLVGVNGGALPTTNVDPANKTKGTVRAGSALLEVAPSVIEFSPVLAGQTGPVQTVTLTNRG